MKSDSRTGIVKKLIGAHGIGLILFFLLAISSYAGIKTYSSVYKRSDELSRRVELVSDLQRYVQKIIMPPNDYLITGDIKERKKFANLVTETAAIFEKMRLTGTRAKEEAAATDEVEKGLIELQQKAMVILSSENPLGNKAAAALMKEMDAFADELENKAERLHDLVRLEIDSHDKRVNKTTSWMYGIFIALTLISLSGMTLLGFAVRRRIALPLIALTKAAMVIGKGNLDYAIDLKTGDEIESLGVEINKMALSLKTKINEAKEYSELLETANRKLDQNILQLYALYSISKNLTATLEMEKLLNQVVEGVSRALKLRRINIMLVSPDKTELYVVSGTDMQAVEKAPRFKFGEGIYGWIALTGNAEVINNLAGHPRFSRTVGIDDDVSSLISVPFKGRGQVIGLINAYRLDALVFDESSYELLIAVASQIGMALENARLFEETKTLAITDGMTTLYNYRYFTERLNEEFERAQRYKRDLSLIMVDIDHFKNYNDVHGHPAGDNLLRNFSEILKMIMRNSDIVSRYGGEEFVIILPETRNAMAVYVAERLRKEVELRDFEGGEIQPGGRVTISLGVASFSEEIKSADALVKSADNALYRSKELGRNRVSVYNGGAV